MGWRFTLAYYAAATLGGSLFVALAYYGHSVARWGLSDRWIAGFFFVYALAFAGGLPAQLVNAFALRRIARALGWHSPWLWLVMGSIIGWVVVWGFARLGYLIERTYFPAEWQSVKALLVVPFLGPIMFSAQPLWLLLAVAAATALVLRRVHAWGLRRALPGWAG